MPLPVRALAQGGGRAAPASPPADLDRARLIAAVHRWVDEYGRPPRVIDWEPSLARLRGRSDLAERFEADGTWPTFTKVRRHFRGLGDLLRAAGYPPAPRRAGRYRREWTSTEVLAAIRRWTELYGEPPTMADWDPYRARCSGELWRVERYDSGEWPSIKSVRNKFGRLSDAVATAGLVPRRQGQRRADDAPRFDVETLLHVMNVRGLGDRAEPSRRLAEAVRRVAAQRGRSRPADLRAALVELAAVAMSWAARLE